MTNYEHFEKEIEKFARMGLKVAVKKDKNEIVACGYLIDCKECLFSADAQNRTCMTKAVEWADAEYIEPEVDWSKVPVDTPILVKPKKECK